MKYIFLCFRNIDNNVPCSCFPAFVVQWPGQHHIGHSWVESEFFKLQHDVFCRDALYDSFYCHSESLFFCFFLCLIRVVADLLLRQVYDDGYIFFGGWVHLESFICCPCITVVDIPSSQEFCQQGKFFFFS